MHPKDLRIEDYTYSLPDELIAKYPLAERDASKLLIYKDGTISEDIYRNAPAHIPADTLMIFNQAKVVHARLFFTKATGGVIEVFCLSPHVQYADIQTAMQQKGEVLWECLIGGASKWKNGMTLALKNDSPAFTLTAAIANREQGSYTLSLKWDNPALTFAEVLHHVGQVPLPPYLHRKADTNDEKTYQTVYAKEEGSVAAPTAGLHFTEDVLNRIEDKGIEKGFVTLHVGAGTFIPVKSETMTGHNMHAEWIEITKETVQQLIQAKGKQIVTVGTTSMRTIESLYWIGNQLLNGITPALHEIAVTQWEPYDTLQQHDTPQALTALHDYMLQHSMDRLITRTQILIAPGYKFRIITGLITNFHQPESTLLLLVAAMLGNDWRRVYDYAMSNNYRFLSYGDGGLLWL